MRSRRPFDLSLGALSIGALLLAALLGACGAKTGLDIPDSSFDAPLPRDTPPDVPIDGCVARTLPLTPIRPEVMFVLDRSTSMSWALSGPGGSGPTRYAILVDALRAQLPRYDARSDMGSLLYPEGGGEGCELAPRPQIEPGPMRASDVLDLVAGSGPSGRTPTSEALATAQSYFSSHPDPSRSRAVVLATDGAPNCNSALDPRTCPCTGGGGLPVGGCSSSGLCLDDARAIEVIQRLASDGVPTYVVGIDGDPDPAVSAVLTRMALAGERPNPLDLGRAYYSVRRPADLAAAFDRIQASIVSCTLSLEAPVPAGRSFVVTMDGVRLPRDGTRREGWEFAAGSDTSIELYGETCARSLDGAHVLVVELTCEP
jgi:hypothetical protein